MSNVEKFSYLASKVDGDAKRAILGLSLTNDNYKIAIQFLKERFGEPQDVIDSHYTELMKLSQATNRMSDLRDTNDMTEKHLRSLEALGQDLNRAVFFPF